MQCNLDFLEIGNTFPPATEAWRLKQYQDMRTLFKGHTERVINGYWGRFNGGDKTQNVKFIELNYFKLLASKTADLVCGEKPDVKLPDDINKNDEQILNKITTNINKRIRRAVIDFVRYGDCIIRPYLAEVVLNKEPKVSILNPSMFVAVVDPEDLSEYKHQVIGYHDTDESGQSILVLQIHNRGSYVERIHKTKAIECSMPVDGVRCKYIGYEIGKLISEDTKLTGITDFAIKHIANEPTSDCIYGISDFEAIASIVADLEVRFAQRDIILDKHAAPSIAAPESNFTYSEKQDGEIVGVQKGLKLGDAWVMDENGIPRYVTWDGQLAAVERDIADKMQQLFILSEQGAVLDDSQKGGTQGYEALQVRMVNARLKARRIVEEIDPVYRQLIAEMYKLETGKDLKIDITVTWNDGLPNDAKRDAEVAVTLANNNILSRKTIRQEYHGMSEKQAELEQEQIDTEQPATFATNIFE